MEEGSSLQCSQNPSLLHNFCQTSKYSTNVTPLSVQRVKQPKFIHLPLSNTKVRNMWSYTSMPLNNFKSSCLIKIKEKLSLFTPRRPIGRMEVFLHSFLSLALDGSEWLTFRGPFTLQPEKYSLYFSHVRVGGFQNRPGRFEAFSLPCRNSNTE